MTPLRREKEIAANTLTKISHQQKTLNLRARRSIGMLTTNKCTEVCKFLMQDRTAPKFAWLWRSQAPKQPVSDRLNSSIAIKNLKICYRSSKQAEIQEIKAKNLQFKTTIRNLASNFHSNLCPSSTPANKASKNCWRSCATAINYKNLLQDCQLLGLLINQYTLTQDLDQIHLKRVKRLM